jgi:hypothetical protein
MSQQPVGNCFICKQPVFEKDEKAWVEYQGKYYHLDHHGITEWHENEMKKRHKPIEPSKA